MASVMDSAVLLPALRASSTCCSRRARWSYCQRTRPAPLGGATTGPCAGHTVSCSHVIISSSDFIYADRSPTDVEEAPSTVSPVKITLSSSR